MPDLRNRHWARQQEIVLRSARWTLLVVVLEVAVVIAALASVPLVVAQLRGDTGIDVLAIDWVLWSIFLIEYVVMTSLVVDRHVYIRRNWLSVVIILASFPVPDLAR